MSRRRHPGHVDGLDEHPYTPDALLSELNCPSTPSARETHYRNVARSTRRALHHPPLRRLNGFWVLEGLQQCDPIAQCRGSLQLFPSQNSLGTRSLPPDFVPGSLRVCGKLFVSFIDVAIDRNFRTLHGWIITIVNDRPCHSAKN